MYTLPRAFPTVQQSSKLNWSEGPTNQSCTQWPKVHLFALNTTDQWRDIQNTMKIAAAPSLSKLKTSTRRTTAGVPVTFIGPRSLKLLNRLADHLKTSRISSQISATSKRYDAEDCITSKPRENTRQGV